MAGVENHSEYEGGGLMPNTVFPMGPDALTASDELRLDSLTGQHSDSRAPVNPAHWHGAARNNGDAMKQYERERRQQLQALRQSESQRYKESPY